MDFRSDYVLLFTILLLFPKFLIFSGCLYYSYLTRNIDNDYNESKQIFFAIWHVCFIFMVVSIMLLLFYDQARVVDLYYGAACAILFAFFICYVLLYAKFIFGNNPFSFSSPSKCENVPKKLYVRQVRLTCRLF